MLVVRLHQVRQQSKALNSCSHYTFIPCALFVNGTQIRFFTTLFTFKFYYYEVINRNRPAGQG